MFLESYFKQELTCSGNTLQFSVIQSEKYEMGHKINTFFQDEICPNEKNYNGFLTFIGENT